MSMPWKAGQQGAGTSGNAACCNSATDVALLWLPLRLLAVCIYTLLAAPHPLAKQPFTPTMCWASTPRAAPMPPSASWESCSRAAGWVDGSGCCHRLQFVCLGPLTHAVACHVLCQLCHVPLHHILLTPVLWPTLQLPPAMSACAGAPRLPRLPLPVRNQLHLHRGCRQWGGGGAVELALRVHHPAQARWLQHFSAANLQGSGVQSEACCVRQGAQP